MATRITTGSRNAACDAIVDRLDAGAGAGKLRVYTGTQPASANDAVSGTLLAEFTLSDPAFGASATGTATAAAISDTTGLAAGTAGWFRAVDSDGNGQWDGSVGTSGQDLNLNTTTISIGVTVSVSSWTVTMPSGE